MPRPFELSITPCRPESVVEAVELMHSAGPDAYNYVFSDRHASQSKAFLANAYQSVGTDVSHRQHLGGYADGRLIALGSLKYPQQTVPFTLAALVAIVREYGHRAVPVLVRGLRTEAVIRPPSKGTALLCNLAVAEDCRGQGIGERMIDELVAQAMAAGAVSVQLDVAETNPDAQRLYLRKGFRRVADYRNDQLISAFGRVVGHQRMELQCD